MDYQNFENETFNELPELIVASNFKNCTFNKGTKIERCNLDHCEVKEACYFDRSNVLVCTGEGLDSSTYDKSNRRDEEDEKEIRG